VLKVHGKHFVVEFRGRELADLVVEFVGAVLVVEETVTVVEEDNWSELVSTSCW